MTAQPHWSPVDDATADLLTLVADLDHPSVDWEWHQYVRRLKFCAAADDGLVLPNTLRPMVRHVVAPRRIGAFANRALKLGLVEYTGDWQISDDHEGKNAGKPARVMRWIGESS